MDHCTSEISSCIVIKFPDYNSELISVATVLDCFQPTQEMTKKCQLIPMNNLATYLIARS